MIVNDKKDNFDVAIIGGGPSGLSMAIELKRLGVKSVALIERENLTGGIPRHCGHPPFGMREFKRVYTGPEYARKLSQKAINSQVDIYTQTTVVGIDEFDRLIISQTDGIKHIEAKRIVIATGIRETPRSARLVSGQRGKGITTTGALQSMIYLSKQTPCRNPIVIGSELVAFSSLITLRHAKIKPVMMIEKKSRITALSVCRWLAKMLRVPILLDTELVTINGNDSVSSVLIKNKRKSKEEIIDCDGVIFTGQFIPEATIVRDTNLTVDSFTNGPVVNQYGQCSNPKFYACGNLLRPVETAGWCWQEGKDTAKIIFHDINDSLLLSDNHIDIEINQQYLQYVMPQKIRLPVSDINKSDKANLDKVAKAKFQVRFNQSAKGLLSLRHNDKIIWQKKIRALPERRILIPISVLSNVNTNDKVMIDFIADAKSAKNSAEENIGHKDASVI